MAVESVPCLHCRGWFVNEDLVTDQLQAPLHASFLFKSRPNTFRAGLYFLISYPLVQVNEAIVVLANLYHFLKIH